MDGPSRDNILCPPRLSSLRASSNKHDARLYPKDAQSQHEGESIVQDSQSNADEANMLDKRRSNNSLEPGHTSSSGVASSKDLNWKTHRRGKKSKSSMNRSIDAQSATGIPSIVKTSSSPPAPEPGSSREVPSTNSYNGPDVVRGVHQGNALKKSARARSTDSRRSSSFGTDTLHPIHGQSKSHILDDPPGAGFFNLAHFLSVQTHDATSKAATTRSDTSRIDDLNAESPESYSTPMGSPFPGSQSYYIFAPRSTGSAYYLHRSSDGSTITDSEFRITKVPMTLIPHETGGLSYMVRAAEEDSTSSGGSDHDALCLLKAREGSSSSYSTKHSPCLESPKGSSRPDLDVYHGLGGKKPTRRVHDASVSNSKLESSIMAKVNRRLAAQRNCRDNIKVIGDNGKPISGTNNMFLVNSRDIQDVVSIVMAEMQTAKKDDQGEANKTKEDCRRLSGPKLDEISNMIRLPSVSAADPATTISMPRTSYASVSADDLQVHTRVRGEDSDTMTTVISRKSVAEITWPHKTSHIHQLEVYNGPGHSRAVSESSTPTQKTPVAYSSGRRQSEPPFIKGEFVFHHYSTPINEGEVVSDMSRRQSRQQEQKQEKKTSDATDITSFPRLLPRRCTKDWIVPPTEVDVVPLPPVNLHNQGVNSQGGRTLDGPAKFFQGQPKIRHNSHDAFSNGLFAPKLVKKNSASTTDDSSTFAETQLDTSTRTEYLKHRSSQPQSLQDSYTDSYDSFFPSIIDKIKQGSHKILYGNNSSKGSNETFTPSHVDDCQQGNGRRSRNSVV